MWYACGVPGVDVASFGGVPIEGGVPVWRGGLPMPLPGVQGKVLDKARFEDPKGRCFLTCGFQFLGDFEGRPGAFLGENSDRAKVAGGDGDDLIGGGLNASVGPTLLNSIAFDALPSHGVKPT